MTDRHKELEVRIAELEEENRRLRAGLFSPAGGDTVRVPEQFRELFALAQQTVDSYFRDIRADPSRGTIEIGGERYVLLRAASLSYGFLHAIRKLYADRGDAEAFHIGRTLLFDMAHIIGIQDAREFHRKMGLTDPVAKLSAGPVHFAYSGWAFVDLHADSSPSPDENYLISYHHPFSFESDSWLRAGKSADFPVCIMNAGYSSGWCEESFGIPLAATEIACKAKGDENCTFVMAPPNRLREHVARIMADAPEEARRSVLGAIPTLYERKDVEERLREALGRAEAASEAKSMFLANMSHEIRTPLTGLLGMSELLLLDDLTDEQKSYAETIHESGHALLDILNDILDLSKIEAGKLSISAAACSVREVIRDVADVLRARVDAKDLVFSVEIDDSVPPYVVADPLRLRQIVFNLAGNSVKFTDKGSIAIRSDWKEPGQLKIEVEDSGIGIDPSRIEQLFELFTQADSSDTRRFSGTGLGLSICKRLVHLMGGEIGARGEPGLGSNFWFVIPAIRTDCSTAPRSEPKPRKLRFNAHVLLVEDDRIARYVVEKMLKETGCSVETVPDGRGAIPAVSAGNFDVVFLDCQMPIMDGYETTARIRQLEGDERHTPIVAMTASVMQGQRERCLASGMDDFLGKPLDLHRLQAALARWVEPI
ncbi:MAG: hybrid sensor histidine kinase/response regulator [Planctomycetota bacterium]|jgi:signal transduction histidine kinase